MLIDEDIIKMYKEGVLPRDISLIDGRTIGTIYRILHKNNVEVSDKRLLSQHVSQEIINLYNSGFTSREVAKITNVSSGHIRTLLKNKNVVKNKYEVYNISEEDILSAIAEYNEGKGATSIVKKYNFSDVFLYSELKKRGYNIRTYSEANCLSNTNKRKRGLKGFIRVNNKDVKFESFYELLFIINCIKNNELNSFDRCADVIKYRDSKDKDRHYNPDFIVEDIYGNKCVIEVKPICRVNESDTLKKKEYAELKYDCYKIVTELDLILYEKSVFEKFSITTDEDLDKYIKRYKNKIKNGL